MHLNFVPCLISIHFNFVPRPIYFAFHVFHVLSLLRLILINTLSVSCMGSNRVSHLKQRRLYLKMWALSQVMSRLRPTSRNQLCVTRFEIGDIGRNKMYIERADILHSVEQLKSVTHEISYLQPIHWSDFRFTFWQIMEPVKFLLAYELCFRILLSLTFVFWFMAAWTYDLWLKL